MSKGKSEKRLLTIQQAADYIGVSRATLHGWLARGIMPYEELPSRGGVYHFRRIRRADLDEFLNSNYRAKKAEQSASPAGKTGTGSIFLLPK